jgi:cytochrome P450/ferredoxin
VSGPANRSTVSSAPGVMLPTVGVSPALVSERMAELRRAEGLVEVAGNVVCVARASDIDSLRADRCLSHDVAHWSSFPAAALRLSSVRARVQSVLASDGDAHITLRRKLARALKARSGVVDEAVAATIDTTLAGALEQPAVDIVTDVARPIAARAMALLVGFPTTMASRLGAWSGELSPLLRLSPASLGERMAAERSYRRFAAYVTRDDVREAAPEGSLLRAIDGHPTSEIVPNVVFLFCAGYETMADFFATTVIALIDHRDELADALAAGVSIEQVVDELIRFESPVQVTYRVALEQLDIAGTRIATGALLAMLLGSANHDDAAFEMAGELDFMRPRQPHYAFGVGVHSCPGAGIARAWARAYVRRLLDRLDGLEVAEVRWRSDLSFKGPLHLTVRTDVGEQRGERSAMTSPAGNATTQFVVDETRCIGCGVSSSTAPGLIELANGTAHVRVQPRTPEELQRMLDAVALCPVEALRGTAPTDERNAHADR